MTPIYQLTGVTQGASSTEAYTFDPVGNRLSSLSVPSYTYNSSNEVTAAGSSSYSYDNDGNTLTKTDGTGTTTYTWDFENRLISVHPPNQTTVTFKYDPFGRRIQKTGSVYVFDGANLIEEADGTGNLVARYVFGSDIDEPWAAYRGTTWEFYQADGLGSITSLSTGTGAVSDGFVYDSFGNVTSLTGSFSQPFRYTGREWDAETGLFYYRARYYDPNSGRFLNEDPITFEGGINFYAYVGNNATNSADPFGLCDPSQGIKKCLEKVFGKPIDKIIIQEKIKLPDYAWGATTRKNKIIIYIPCSAFFNDPDTYLEEYYHVLEQWNTGRLSRLKYAAEFIKHGYDKNKYEIEAKEWVKQHIEDFKKCLQCKQPAK